MGVGGLGGGVGSNLVASATKSTYVEDVFKSYLWRGNSTAGRSIDVGIDMAGEGGMTWIKRRNGAQEVHCLNDTVRGAGQYLQSNAITGQTNDPNRLTSFTNTGFTVGNDTCTNTSGSDYVAWNFRKQKGFFDVVTWTGNDTGGRQIPHELDCVPGCVMIKRYNGTEDWAVWHSGATVGTPGNTMTLNNETIATDNVIYFWDTPPTKEHFTVGTSNRVNVLGEQYVAYVFAGAGVTEWSSLFTLSSGYFDYPISLAFEGADPAVVGGWENWAPYTRTSGNYITITMNLSNHNITVGSSVQVFGAYDGTATVTIDGTTHTSSSGTTHTFSNPGTLTQVTFRGNSVNGRTYFTGIKVDGVTLTDGSYLVNGNPNYIDGEESKFGGDGDQNIIKCGRYIGNGSSSGPLIRLGWEPDWVMLKKVSGGTTNADWFMLDSMRGFISDDDDKILEANNPFQESDNAWNLAKLTSLGFKLEQGGASVNDNGQTYLYIAIRRPDGYVGKPALAATDVFDIDGAGGNNTQPTFETGNVVDNVFYRQPASGGASGNWFNTTRLMGPKYLEMNNNGGQQGNGFVNYAYQDGMGGWSGDLSSYQAWAFKRWKGFDVVAYKGDGVDGRSVYHSMNAVPEMIWVKRRNTTGQWVVGHKGLDGGNEPWTHYLTLETTAQEDDYPLFYDTQPTSTYFRVGGHAEVNGNSNEFISMLFSSVAGISKVGSYTGNGTTATTTQEIPTGFSPRFIIIKRVSSTGGWLTFDTVRGLDKRLELNEPAAQDVLDVIGSVSASSFTVKGNLDNSNNNGNKYVYYAHA